MSNLAFTPIAISFCAFGLTLLLGKHRGLQKLVSIAFALGYTLVGGYFLFSVEPDTPLRLALGGWPPPFAISLELNPLAALLISVTGLIYFGVSLYARNGENAEDSPLFWPLIHIIILGISGAFLTADLFNLYVWFEVILLGSFVLITIERSKLRMSGAFKYVIINTLSSLIFLTAAGLIYNATHTLDYHHLKIQLAQLATTNPDYTASLNALLLVGFAIKAALVPFHFWLPASYHHLSPAVSGLFAGMLTKVGLYAIFRINLLIFPQHDTISQILLFLAGASILLGALGAITQLNIRRILGLHIVSQVGFIALGGILFSHPQQEVRLMAITAGIFYMVHHIFVKANLYLVSGLIRQAAGSEFLPKLGGLLTSHLVIALLFAIPALSLAGIPPLSGFWAKLALLRAMLAGEQWPAVVIMLIGGFFTIFSMAKIWLAAFWGQPSSGQAGPSGSISPSALGACLLLGLVTIAIGVYPDALYDWAQAAAQSLTNEVTHDVP